MGLDKDFLEDMLTIINNKTVTYANIYASKEEDNRKDASALGKTCNKDDHFAIL